jgi:hypothetical protein
MAGCYANRPGFSATTATIVSSADSSSHGRRLHDDYQLAQLLPARPLATSYGRSEAPELCPPEDGGDGEPVTENNLSPARPRPEQVGLCGWQRPVRAAAAVPPITAFGVRSSRR